MAMTKLPLLFLCVPSLVASPAWAQSLLFQHAGSAPGDRLGSALSGLDDVDLDSFDDLLVGVPNNDTAGVLAGSVRVVSGLDGSTLREHFGGSALDRFGAALAAVGDLDLDGISDYAIGAPEASLTSSASGYVELFSGAGGLRLYQLPGQTPGERLGFALSGLADIDGDGRAELLASAFQADLAGMTDVGTVRLYAGGSGLPLYEVSGLASGDHFGSSLTSLPDVDGDGREDFAVGADQAGNGGPGYVEVFSGASGNWLYRLDGLGAGDGFGFALSATDDLDGDLRPDLAVGAPHAFVLGVDAGRVEVFSGATGVSLLSAAGQPGEQFGHSLACFPDLDLDGLGELVVGAPFAVTSTGSNGAVRILSSASAALLREYALPGQGDAFGWAVANGGDVDGDGFDDLCVGAPRADVTPLVDAGELSVFNGAVDPPMAPTVYCTAKLDGAGCQAQIGAQGMPQVSGAGPFDIRAANVPPGRPGTLLFAAAPLSMPFMGGWLCVSPPLSKTVPQVSGGSPGVSCSGVLIHDMHAALAGAISPLFAPGERVHVQFMYRDGGHPLGAVALTDALLFDVLP